MRALLSIAPGGPETLVLGEVANPVAGPGEVVVRVRACSLNYPDVLIIEDRYQLRPPRPFSPGSDIAGIVQSVGPDVAKFSVGDRVWGTVDWGGLAELAAVPFGKLDHLSTGIAFETAAAASLTYRTAYHGLVDRGAIQAGERLLVLGAGGGVGGAAIELGKLLGAHVIAGASSQQKLDLARALGADETHLYDQSNDTKALSKSFKVLFPDFLDVVFDPVGGAYAEAALRRLGYGGRLLVVGFAAGLPRLPLNLPLLKSCQVVGVNLGALRTARPDLDRANTEAVASLLASGRLKLAISATIPLEAAVAALECLASRSLAGRVVVTL